MLHFAPESPAAVAVAAIGLKPAPAEQHEDVVEAHLRREQLVAHIRGINGTADTDWLNGFNDEQLALYLEHLQQTLEPRGRASRWIRRGDTPGIVWRMARD